MGYRILADIVVVIHGLFILFAIFGWLLVSTSPRWALLHIPALLWAGIIELTGGACPLTPLEKWLRARGHEAGYDVDFIGRYLLPLIYPDEMTRNIQVFLGLFVIIFNIAIYAAILFRFQKKHGGNQ